jgi:hypothetical protein
MRAKLLKRGLQFTVSRVPEGWAGRSITRRQRETGEGMKEQNTEEESPEKVSNERRESAGGSHEISDST